MTRSLEGRKFYVCSNNGVKTIIEERILRNLEKFQAIERKLGFNGRPNIPQLPITPIFTFVENSRWLNEPWTTGTRALFLATQIHIAEQGGKIEGGSFHVPFSNGGLETLTELLFVTSELQFEEAFGISLQDMLLKT